MRDDKTLIDALVQISQGCATSKFDVEIKEVCKEAAVRLKILIGSGRMPEDELVKRLQAVAEAGDEPEHILNLCDQATRYISEMHETLDYARTIQTENVRLTMEVARKQAALDAAIRDFKIIENSRNYPLENRPCSVCKKIGLYCSSGGASCKGFEWRGTEEVTK